MLEQRLRPPAPAAPRAPGIRASPRRSDAVMAVLAVGLAGITVLLWVDPALSPSFVAPELDVAINVVATLVAAAVAILGWVRWSEHREPAALYASSAFMALASTNALTIGAVLIGRPELFGLAIDQSPAVGSTGGYLWTLARFAAGILLVVGGIQGLRRADPRLPPLVVAFLPAVSLLVIGAVVGLAGVPLPALVGPLDLAGDGDRLSRATAVAMTALQIGVSALFFIAAVLFRRLLLRDGLVSHSFFAAGFVVAGFSQLHFALQPIVTNGIVTSADVLRLLFYAILFFGIEAEAQADMAQIRGANAELERLREVDAANATLAERSRLAREIHDGLAQDLWFAKLKQSRLVEDEAMDDAARATAREVMDALDQAIADARNAVMALRASPTSRSSLQSLLEFYVSDFGDRFGLPTAFESGRPLPPLPPRTEAELLRIVQEALNNVRKHADATLVRVQVEQRGQFVRLAVTDNGRGFEPDAVGEGSFGLTSMRERAELVGGRLEVRSRRSDGTEVVVEVPADLRVAP